MNDIIMTLVFSIVMLVFMIFPAMKIVEWIETKIELTHTMRNTLQFFFIILLSLSIGIFLRFA